MEATLLHSVAVGNCLPSFVKTICVDINPSSLTKADGPQDHAGYRGGKLDAGHSCPSSKSKTGSRRCHHQSAACSTVSRVTGPAPILLCIRIPRNRNGEASGNPQRGCSPYCLDNIIITVPAIVRSTWARPLLMDHRYGRVQRGAMKQALQR